MKNTTKYQNIHGNRKHKDSLFCMIFGRKKDLLELYNAINGTSYDNPDELEINTLDNALYMTVKNDVSCIIDCRMNLYEHQSTLNPNMPLRGFIYFSKLYSKYIDQRKLNVYSEGLQKIPTPQYIVFYNGMEDEPDRQTLRLSDAFQRAGGCLECEAVMLNINHGHNRELMEKCKPLAEYSAFITIVREYVKEKQLSLEDAIDCAIDECVREGILRDILISQRAEVHMSILETFDKELYEQDLKERAEARGLQQGIEQGIERGIERGKQQTLIRQIERKLAKGKNVQEIADDLEETVEVIEELISQIRP